MERGGEGDGWQGRGGVWGEKEKSCQEIPVYMFGFVRLSTTVAYVVVQACMMIYTHMYVTFTNTCFPISTHTHTNTHKYFAGRSNRLY